MGKDKKVDPAKAAAKKARTEAKQKKTLTKRNKKELKETGEDDIESIIAEFQERDRQRTAVSITITPQPSPRSNFSLTLLTNQEMLLFGGEFCDGESTSVYNDVYRWNMDRNEWKLIESLNTPPPRCSHQAVFYKDQIFIFGGEYATLDQFHHYRDMWALDIKTNIWREISPKGDVPSPRSGHRMVVWRNYLVLFGGFYEALKEVRWFNDLYLFSFQEERWIQIPPRQYMPMPKPRSGFVMMLHPAGLLSCLPSRCLLLTALTEDSIFIFGGYSKEKSISKKSEGKIHTDMWMLNLRGILPSSGAGAAGISRLDTSRAAWQKLSNKGSPPSPRCGASMVTYKNKGIYFGGVFDDEGPRHTIQSSFYNDLYAFDFERKRWYELGVKHASALTAGKKKRRKVKASSTEEKAESGESSGDEEEEGDDDAEDDEIERQEQLYQAQENLFGYIDDSGNIVYVNIDESDDLDNDVAPPSSLSTAPAEDGWINISSVSDSALPSMSDPITEEAVLIDHLTLSSTENILSPPPPQTSSSNFSVQLSQSEILQAAFLEEDLRGAAMAGGSHESMLLPPTPPNPLVQFFDKYDTAPVGRINCQLVTKGCTLYIYGGVTEFGDVEITLDDCWSLDLNKRDKWRSVLKGTMTELVWKGNDGDDQSERTGDGDSDDDDDDDDDDESDEEEDAGEEDDNRKKSKSKKSSKRSQEGGDEDDDEKNDKKGSKVKSKSSRAGIRGEMDDIRSQLPGGGEDSNKIPLTGAAAAGMTHGKPPAAGKKQAITGPEVESLRDFYSRTSAHWKEFAIEMWQKGAVNLDGVLISSTSATPQSGDGEENVGSVTSPFEAAVALPISSEPLAEKELKRIAFSLCQYHYEEILPLVARLAELEDSVGLQEEEGGKGKGGSRGKSSRKG